MDPYIEFCGLWGDFHQKLISEIERALSTTLPERYVVRTGERSYIDYVNSQQELQTSSQFTPDVKVLALTPDKEELDGTTAVAEDNPAVVTMHGLVETEFHEAYLDIFEIDPQRRLVTSIEVLSPANKRFASAGWIQYERKRQVFLRGLAHLVEIDLLRRGRRMPMEEQWAEVPYYILVMRKEQAPRCSVHNAHFMEPLPTIPIPLLAPDPDLMLALQPLVDAIYQRSRYQRDIKYEQPLRPMLNRNDAEWLSERLKDRGITP